MRAMVVGSVLLALLGVPAGAMAQGGSIVLVVEAGSTRLNVDRLSRGLRERIRRSFVRLTDRDAQDAEGRLTIAFSRPDRWVLRYESHGAVAWVSDRIPEARRMRPRLVRLAEDLVRRVDASTQVQSSRRWDAGDVILALQNEIVDPFADVPPRPVSDEPIAILWSEVVDPFRDDPRPRRRRAAPTELASEVIDPWGSTPVLPPLR